MSLEHIQAFSIGSLWAAWEASEEQRAEALNEMRRGDAASPGADLADKLRPEVAMAIALAEQLVDRPEMLSRSPQRDPERRQKPE